MSLAVVRAVRQMCLQEETREFVSSDSCIIHRMGPFRLNMTCEWLHRQFYLPELSPFMWRRKETFYEGLAQVGESDTAAAPGPECIS